MEHDTIENDPSQMSLFKEQISRKPNLYPWTEQFIEAMHNGFWTDKEFNFKSDVQQFKVELNDQERKIAVRSKSLEQSITSFLRANTFPG